MNGPIIHIVYNLIRGGTEGQCARVAMGLRKLGGNHRVVVFEKRGYFLAQIEQTCGPVYELPIRRVASWRTWTEVVQFARWLKKENAVLIHAWDADAAMFGSLAARLAGIPYITSRRDLGAIYPDWKLRWMAWADSDARAVIVNTGAVRESLRAAGCSTHQVELIPNLFDITEFDRLANLPFSQASRLSPGRILVMVARLDSEKDAPTLIRAFGRLGPVFPDLSLVLAGDGPERLSCERLARDLGLAEKTVFLGEVNDVPALLRRSTVGALVPSRNEGQSNSILEYFAAGLPVVVTDCGGNRELVDGAGAGFVVPVGADERVADACAEILRRPDLARRMGMAGRRKVEQEHAAEKVLARFQDLYSRCLA